MTLLGLLHFAILIAQFGSSLLELSPSNLPERVNLVPLELEEVALLALPVQLLLDAAQMLDQLLWSHLVRRDAIKHGRRFWPALFLVPLY